MYSKSVATASILCVFFDLLIWCEDTNLLALLGSKNSIKIKQIISFKNTLTTIKSPTVKKSR